MDADTAGLDAIVQRLQSLDKVGVEIAKDALPTVLAAARETAAAGTAPDGSAWKPTKSGKAPLANASSKITAEVSGLTEAVVTLVLRGPEVYHHHGTGRLPARPILPTAATGVPSRIRDAVRESAERIVGKKVSG